MFSRRQIFVVPRNDASCTYRYRCDRQLMMWRDEFLGLWGSKVGNNDILKTNIYFWGVSTPQKVVESKGSLINLMIYNLFLVDITIKIHGSLLSRHPAIVLYVFSPDWWLKQHPLGCFFAPCFGPRTSAGRTWSSWKRGPQGRTMSFCWQARWYWGSCK